MLMQGLLQAFLKRGRDNLQLIIGLGANGLEFSVGHLHIVLHLLLLCCNRLLKFCNIVPERLHILVTLLMVGDLD